jgi:hypothetical protein
MLKHCFELGYRRVEWKCHSLNERSRRSALRMGFKFKGIQESHMIVKDCNRDTAWFRILDHEWPVVKKYLENSLYRNKRWSDAPQSSKYANIFSSDIWVWNQWNGRQMPSRGPGLIKRSKSGTSTEMRSILYWFYVIKAPICNLWVLMLHIRLWLLQNMMLPFKFL